MKEYVGLSSAFEVEKCTTRERGAERRRHRKHMFCLWRPPRKDNGNQHAQWSGRFLMKCFLTTTILCGSEEKGFHLISTSSFFGRRWPKYYINQSTKAFSCCIQKVKLLAATFCSTETDSTTARPPFMISRAKTIDEYNAPKVPQSHQDHLSNLYQISYVWVHLVFGLLEYRKRSHIIM